MQNSTNMAQAPSIYLEQSVRFLKGVGPQREKIFKKIGIQTLQDLLFYFPRTHQDRSSFKPIPKLVIGEIVSLKGKVVKKRLKRIKRMTIFEIDLQNETGLITAIWFNQPYLETTFEINDIVIISGKVEFYRKLQISSPEYEIITDEAEEAIHTGRIVPIYALTEGLSQKTLRSILYRLIHEIQELIQDYLPCSIRQNLALIDLKEAIVNFHFPPSFNQLEKSRNRLVFDDFFILQLVLALHAQKREAQESSFKVSNPGKLLNLFLDALSFQPTLSQKEACQEILKDFSKSYPMNRLLQGDVGSGKTLVAACAMWTAFKHDRQAALLVPTEILAEQHAQSLTRLYEPFKIAVHLLTSQSDLKIKKEITQLLNEGKPAIVVGTHALLQSNVAFKNLGLVVIDEQHKFGVAQRSHLLKSNVIPHVLVMTATPIPRTLTLAFYGDLAVSSLKEFPKGPKQIKTWWLTRKKEPEVFRFIKERVQKGEQAFIVFPAIEENEKTEILAAKKMYEELSKNHFRTLKVGLIHGKMKKQEKDKTMNDFRNGKIHILVATTVIEVGIDTPESSVIVIENAERFGLSQLHQLRGRVGRHGKEGFCFLIADPKTDEGKMRLRILTKSCDGFVIAEEDLKLRGPGDLLGVRQSGVPLFFIADLIRDKEILEIAKKEAFDCIHAEQNINWLKHPFLKPRLAQIENLLQ